MPEDSKKNHDKHRNDPKEQRKPRNSRNQASKYEKKTEKVEESKFCPKVPQKPPVYEDPGPEFYKNLKRETDEILKITEEENSKYKKKEIQSNWAKYEMPIETYEDIEEHDVGADYEKLIQAPLSVGGHFQFKHEKSWDVNTGPSLYDKYFEIDMDNLSLAMSTVPFYERNSIEKSLFSETDMLSMNNRATKHMQKYYNDKSFATAETEAHDRILNSLKESLSKNKVYSEKVEADCIETEKDDFIPENIKEDTSMVKDDINLDFTKTDSSPVHSNNQIEEKVKENKCVKRVLNDKIGESIDVDHTAENTTVFKLSTPKEDVKDIDDLPKEVKETTENIIKHSEDIKKCNDLPTRTTASKSSEINPEIKDNPVEITKNPVIESPEDLEKWLDDFLDG